MLVDQGALEVEGIEVVTEALREEARGRAVYARRSCEGQCSWGRCWLNSLRNLSNARCWAANEWRAGEAVSRLSVRCIRSWRPFCCGLPGSILSRRVPRRMSQAEGSVSPPRPVEAKGGPLSDRIASGSPYSRNADSRTQRVSAVSGCPTIWQRSRKRLKAS